MSYQKRGFFTIRRKVSESSYKIQENVPESAEELIEIAQSGPAKTKNGKPLILLKTTDERQFVNLEGWPKTIFMEILQS